MLECPVPVLIPKPATPPGKSGSHWAQNQLSEYVLDLLAEHAPGYSFDKQRQEYFSGPFHIGKATFKKLREGLEVNSFIIKRFARGLRLNQVERAELFIRYGELLLQRHTNEVADIEAWSEAYLDHKTSVLNRIHLQARLKPRSARAGFGRFVRTHLWYRYNAAFMAHRDKTQPICDVKESKEATVRALAEKMKMRERPLHDALTTCSLTATMVPRLAELLQLTEPETRELQALYIEGVMSRQMLWLQPGDIEKYFDPYFHTRLV